MIPFSRKQVAFVRCAGGCKQSPHTDFPEEKTSPRFSFAPPPVRILLHKLSGHDCRSFASQPSQACENGCLGLGSCTTVCIRNAIRICDGVAAVDSERCIGCGACIRMCPKNLITLIPADGRPAVRCSSHKKGTEVRTVCKTGCIGCGLCVKQCAQNAITLDENLARIDTSRCIGCGKCADQCPAKVIVFG